MAEAKARDYDEEELDDGTEESSDDDDDEDADGDDESPAGPPAQPAQPPRSIMKTIFGRLLGRRTSEVTTPTTKYPPYCFQQILQVCAWGPPMSWPTFLCPELF